MQGERWGSVSFTRYNFPCMYHILYSFKEEIGNSADREKNRCDSTESVGFDSF